MKLPLSFFRAGLVAAAAAGSMSAHAINLLGLELPLFPTLPASPLPIPTAIPVLDLTPIQQPLLNPLIGTLLGAGLPNPTALLPNLTAPLGGLLNPLLGSPTPTLPTSGLGGFGALPTSLIDIGLPGVVNALPAGVPNGIPGVLTVSDSVQGLTVGVLNTGTGPVIGLALGGNALALPALPAAPTLPGAGALPVSLIDIGLPGVTNSLPAGVPNGIPGVLTVSDSVQGLTLGVLNTGTGPVVGLALGGNALAFPALPALPGAGSLPSLPGSGSGGGLPNSLNIPGLLNIGTANGLVVDVLPNAVGSTSPLLSLALGGSAVNAVTAVPEASSWAMMGLGLVGMAALSSRRRRA